MAKRNISKTTIKKAPQIINASRNKRELRRSARLKQGSKTKAIQKANAAVKSRSQALLKKKTMAIKTVSKTLKQLKKLKKATKERSMIKQKISSLPKKQNVKPDAKKLNKTANKKQTKSQEKSSKSIGQITMPTNVSAQKKVRQPSKYFESLLQNKPMKGNSAKKGTKKISTQQMIQTTEQPMQRPLKSLSELQRIKRSQSQRIFLIAAARKPQEWSFRVMGTKGSLYQVVISNKVKCNCIDFRTHRQPCKHIYFIVTQVAKKDQILEEFQTKSQIQASTYGKLDEYLIESLKSFIKKEGELNVQEVNLKDDKDCTICFCQMETAIEKVEKCCVCKKYFHQQCLKAWKKVNNSCPLCRSAFEKKELNSLGKLEEVILEVA